MNKFLRSAMLLLVILSIVFVAACSGNNNGNNGNTAAPAEEEPATNNTTEEVTNEEPVAEEEEPAPAEPAVDQFKLPELTEVVFAKSVHDIKIYPEGEDPSNNVVYKMMEPTMNIKATNKFAVPFENYQQRLKLGIASNDLPDIFFADQATLEELIKNDMLVDLAPIYEKYATENTKKVMGFRDGLLFKGAQKGEAIYGMPTVSDSLNGIPVVYIRKDWMEKLGAEMPKTFEELMDLAVRFTKEDPDGNGKADTYGLSMNNQLDLVFSGLMNAYGAYPRVYLKGEDGKLTYGSIDDKMKDGLQKMQDLFKEGVFDKEFATKDMPTSMSTVSAGSVGILIGQFFSPLWPLQDVPKNVPGSDFVSMPVPGLGGGEYVPEAPINNGGGYFVVRKDFKNPEALIILINNLSETGYSNLENEWAKGWAELNKDQKYANAGINNWLPVFTDRPDANTNRYNLFKDALDTNDDTKMPVDQRTTFLNVKAGMEGDPANWPWWKTFLEGVPHASSYQKVVSTEWVGSATKTGLLKGANLTKLEDETFIRIIIGDKPVSAFDEFKQQWLDQGGKEILAEMDEALAAQ